MSFISYVQIMKETQGKATPQMVNKILKENLIK
jgi:Asp-tRNA(Asn)/Glu-tRNA(Gln) amidotransferase B subunit